MTAQLPSRPAQINQIFKLYDKDKSGTLTVSELRKALEKTGIEPDEIQTLFKEYDSHTCLATLASFPHLTPLTLALTPTLKKRQSSKACSDTLSMPPAQRTFQRRGTALSTLHTA